MKRIPQMLTAISSMTLLALCVLNFSAVADERDKLIGNWKLDGSINESFSACRRSADTGC
jgi:hypothetical protein